MPGFATTMPDSTRHTRPRRGPLGIALIAGAVVVAAWIPSFIATAYAEDPASRYLANPAAGWSFLWEAVTASRNPRLGTADAAMQQASQVWAGAPAVADGVSLKALPAEWTVPVPAGAVAPMGARRVATPDDQLNWVVSGQVRGGPEQVIGLLDYRTGRVEWDIRPLAGAAR